MSDDRSTRKTYSEAMNEWAVREGRASFVERSRVSAFVPDPFAHPMARLFGYLWRFGMLGIIGLLVYWYMFRSHLGSEAFTAKFASLVKSALHADSAELTNLKWDGSQASSRLVTATGGPGSFFRSMKATEVSFRIPFSAYWQPEWRLNRIDAVSLQVEFRSGGLSVTGPEAAGLEAVPEGFAAPVLSAPGAGVSLDASAPDPAVAPPATGRDPRALDLNLRKDGLDVSPKLSRLVMSGIKAGRFAAAWGGSEASRGELIDASVWAGREPDGAWSIEVPSGTLNQNWLRGLKLTNLKARYADGSLVIARTPVQVGEAKGVLGGRVQCGEAPEFDLALEVQDFPLEQFCGEPFDRLFNGRADGTLKIKGSVNRATGLTMEGTMQMKSGSIRGLAIQPALAAATTRIRFREFEITGGTVQFVTREGRLEVPAFVLTSRNDVVLRGHLAWDKSEFSGSVELGVDPTLLSKLSPGLQEKFFPKNEAGKLWMAVPLDGGSDRLTQALARELTAAHAAAAKSQ